MCIKVVKIYIQMKINNLCQYLFLVTPLENKFLAQVNARWWTVCLVVLHNPRQAFAGLGWTVLKMTQAQFRKLFLLVKFKLVTHWVIWITVKLYKKILVKKCLSLVMAKRLRWWLILQITEDQDPESLRLMKLMNSNLQHTHHQMIGIGDHHLNEILIDWILPILNIERFPEVIPNEILKIMSVQSTYVAVMPAVTTIILLKDCSHNKPRSTS